MKTAIVAGATGLIGKELVKKLIHCNQYRTIYTISRTETGIIHEKVKTLIVNFDILSHLNIAESIDDAFCTLGTTMKQAGSKEQFKKVDYQYVLEFAGLARRCGATRFVTISSMGAALKSPAFYNRVKGMTEEALKGVGFSQLFILRPSLLLGKRNEPRIAEYISGFVMKALNFMIPANYRAIGADKVAEYMVKMALNSTEGIKIIESGEIQNG